MAAATEKKGWVTIWPNYLDKRKTVAEGRRVPKEFAVENPTYKEIAEIANHMGFEIEHTNDKAYPRDWLNKGRVRVKVKNADGTAVKPEFPTKMMVCKAIALMIPKLTTRHESGSSEGAQSGGGGGGGKKKKKGGK